MSQSGFLTLGRVHKPHGLKGEFSVDSYANSPFVFDSLSRVYLKRPGQRPRKARIRRVRHSGRQVLLQLEEIQSRQEASGCTDAQIWVRKRDLPEPEPEEVYLADLTGLSVYLPEGERIGELERAEIHAGQELWTIRSSQGGEILFPAREEFVLQLDLEGKSTVIDPPPGLLELYMDDQG